MTSMERVLAAMKGEKLNRPPFTLTLSLYGAGLIGAKIEEYYSRPEKYVEGQKAVLDLIKPDIIFTPFVLAFEAAAFGTEIKFTSESPPIYKKYRENSLKEFLDCKLPDLEKDKNLLYIREATSILSKSIGSSVPLCGITTSPTDLPALILGIDKWIDILVTEPRSAELIIEKTTAHFVSYANKLIDDGANFIAVPMMFINPSLLFPKLIDNTILPAIRNAFNKVKAPIVFHHGGNKITPSLRDYLSLPNVGGFVIDSRDSLSDARDVIGEGRLMLGNINGISLPNSTPELITNRIKSILEDRRYDNNFILASTGADIPMNTPIEILKAISKTIRKRDYE